MPHRTLGRQGLTVSALGLGCMGVSEFYVQAPCRRSKPPLRLLPLP